ASARFQETIEARFLLVRDSPRATYAARAICHLNSDISMFLGTRKRILGQMSPKEANAVIEAQPSATPRTTPASTSLKKCIPRTIRETAMLVARKKSVASSPG